MKLRLSGNVLRLRLSQSDVAELARTGTVRESVPFASGRILSYSLESGTVLSAALELNVISVVAPKDAVTRWIESDQVGIEGASGPLSILIEKDFACLHREGQKTADTFPNPND